MAITLSTRRAFLHKSLGVVAVSATIPAFLEQTAWALDNPEDAKLVQPANGKDGKILVVIQLSGGNDGLSMVVPYGDDAYNRARKDIRIPAKDVLKLDDYVGVHPNLKLLNDLYDDGRMSIIQGVGYPNPNRSHFRSMDIWHTAIPDKENVTTGWLGRYFDNTCVGTDPHIGLSIGDTLPLSMKGERITPLSFEKPDSYQYKGNDRKRYQQLNTSGKSEDDAPPAPKPRSAKGKKSAIPITPSGQLDFLERTALDAQMSSDDILRMSRNFQAKGDYPTTPFGEGLRTVAAMICGELSTRVYYVSLGGFDTHAGQRGRHDQLMSELSQGIAAFWKDLDDQKNSDRVLMMSFSEFGRRVEQNASQGTDHGAAAPMFLLGPKLRAGLMGKHPSLTDLDEGDLKYNVDFRNIYASILQKWLETPSKPILGKQFTAPELFKV